MTNHISTPDYDTVAADLRAVLRDIPATADLDDARAYPLPGELAAAIATHLAHCGARLTDTPDRVWEPPATGTEHYLNPGHWRDTTMENLASQSTNVISDIFAKIIPQTTGDQP